MASDKNFTGSTDAIFVAADGDRYPIRPLQEDDEAAVIAFSHRINEDDIRLRFFHAVRTFDHRFLWPLLHYDHEQAIAYVAFEAASHDIAGVARLHCDILRTFGEFAILVRSDIQRDGLGRFLMTMLIAWAKDRAIPLVRGEVLRENAAMLALCRQLGFRVKASHDDPGVMKVELAIDTKAAVAL